jgi:hypothetical protein
MATQPSQGVAFRKNGEALSRATSGMSVSNYPTIYGGFIQKGIPESEIKPRENVFTYNAWRALVLCIINVFTNKESCGILLHHAATPCSCTPTESIATPGTDENH